MTYGNTGLKNTGNGGIKVLKEKEKENGKPVKSKKTSRSGKTHSFYLIN